MENNKIRFEEGLNKVSPLPDTKPIQDTLLKTNCVNSLKNIDWSKDEGDIVEGLLKEGEHSAWFGARSSGKTLLILHLAKCLATGVTFFNREVRQSKVLYCGLESPKGYQKRISAILKDTEIKDHQFDYLQETLLTLLQKTGEAADFKKLKELVKANAYDVVIIDTLAKSFGRNSENSNDDMNAYFQQIERLIAETNKKLHVIIVHHTGHQGDNMRGGSSAECSVEAMFLVKKLTDGFKFYCEKNKEDEANYDVGFFKTEKVFLGTNAKGKDVNTVIVNEVDRSKVSFGSESLSGAKGKWYSLIKNCWMEKWYKDELKAFISNGERFEHTITLQDCYETLPKLDPEYPTDKPEEIKKYRTTLQQNLRRLRDANILGYYEQHIWFPQQDTDNWLQDKQESSQEDTDKQTIPNGLSVCQPNPNHKEQTNG